jgi:hypothetical protein
MASVSAKYGSSTMMKVTSSAPTTPRTKTCAARKKKTIYEKQANTQATNVPVPKYVKHAQPLAECLANQHLSPNATSKIFAPRVRSKRAPSSANKKSAVPGPNGKSRFPAVILLVVQAPRSLKAARFDDTSTLLAIFAQLRALLLKT